MSHPRILLLLILSVPTAALADNEAAWPSFHGPRRDNMAIETGLLQTWPEAGPELLWKASGIGHGYSSISISGGRIFTAGMIDRQTYVTALDMTGKELWQSLNGQSWQASEQQPWAVPYSGSRGTPTVDGETVYHLSEMGRLTAFDALTGQERWHVDMLKTFDAERPKYGLSESVLIHGDALFCCPGGAGGYVVALEKKTGRLLWANTKIKDPVGYCSPIIARIDDVEQVISMSAERVFSFDPKDGRILWDYPFGNERGNSATDVIVSDGRIYASTGYGGGSVLLQPKRQANGDFSVTMVWKSELLDNHHGGVLLLNDRLYGAGHESRGWFCLDFSTGRKQWESPGKGCLTYADSRLYCLDERGTMTLVEATDDKWKEAGSFRLPRGGEGLYWAHPVICGGRLYVRHSDQLLAYDIRKD
ncbi:MAG: PQQ-binding-like beta-propeller repeat protein [Sedimentisphaerales bacterium]|nr:PQQ-binding-like beta-propeller repeat protein [Sedimentisphaerales bacterium]